MNFTVLIYPFHAYVYFLWLRLTGCLQQAEGNCSKTAVSPYQTILNTVNFLCHTGKALS